MLNLLFVADQFISSTYYFISICCIFSGLTVIIFEQTVHVLRHQWAYSCEKAKAELGYNPRSLKDGLVEMLPWLRSLGSINY